MLLWLFEHLAGYHSSFQVVRYLTLRSLLSVLTALTIGLALGPVMIRKLQALKYGQAVSSFAPENHAKKMGTPTMGGILVLLSIGISTLLWADLSNPYVWIVLAVMVIFGAVGWADDWIKVRYKDNAGLPAKKKFFWTSVGSLGAGIALYVIATHQANPVHTADMLDVLIPFFKEISIPLSAIPLGIGFVVLFRHKASLGGVNILALYLQDKSGIRAGKFQMVVDACIVTASLWVVSLPMLLVSILGAVILNSIIAMNHRPGRYAV